MGQPGAAIRRESTLWMTEVLLAVAVNNALPGVCRTASTRNAHALHRGEIHLTAQSSPWSSEIASGHGSQQDRRGIKAPFRGLYWICEGISGLNTFIVSDGNSPGPVDGDLFAA